MSDNIASLKKLTIKNPEDTSALGMLAEAYRQKGNIAYAIKTYQQLLSITPDNYQVLNNFGTLLRNTGDTDSSIQYLLQANRIFPNSPIILTNLTDTYIAMGRYDLALKTGQQAITLEPNFFDARRAMGNVYSGLGQYAEAKSNFRHALNIQPDNTTTHADVIVLLANSCAFLKEYNEAYELIKPLLNEENPGCAALYFKISHKINARENAVNYITSLLKKKNHKNSAQYAPLYFCLGKHYDEIAQYDVAIENYNEGNKLYGRSFSLKDTQKHFKNITSTFSAKTLKTAQTAGNRSTQPVFVLGMPRSGTSLVEQILSSHPDVYGAGELINIDVAINQLKHSTQYSSAFPQRLNQLSVNALDSMAEKYLDHISSISRNAKYVSDKMPHNFTHIAMILRLFPSARIIHCKRHPLDTCLSCYFSNFGNAGHDYAYNLNHLGKYYIEYQKLMSHWEHCYGNRLYSVRYEDMVSNQVNTSKALFQHCDLTWDDRYLDFHQNKRTVLTFSHEQVNQPLYSSSMYRWKNYEKHLEKLKTILSDEISNYEC